MVVIVNPYADNMVDTAYNYNSCNYGCNNQCCNKPI